MAQNQKPQDEGASHLDRLRREAEVGTETPERTPEKSPLSGGEQSNGPVRG
jgi:hypothetical protein